MSSNIILPPFGNTNTDSNNNTNIPTSQELLLTAIEDCNFNEVQSMVEIFGAKVNEIEKSGVTPFHEACRIGNVDIVNYLISQNADIYARTKYASGSRNIAGNTPLHYAAYGGHIHVAMILLEKGAKINLYNNSGNFRTPEKIARDSGHTEFADLLANRHKQERRTFTINEETAKTLNKNTNNFIQKFQEGTKFSFRPFHSTKDDDPQHYVIVRFSESAKDFANFLLVKTNKDAGGMSMFKTIEQTDLHNYNCPMDMVPIIPGNGCVVETIPSIYESCYLQLRFHKGNVYVAVFGCGEKNAVFAPLLNVEIFDDKTLSVEECPKLDFINPEDYEYVERIVPYKNVIDGKEGCEVFIRVGNTTILRSELDEKIIKDHLNQANIVKKLLN
jgi:hypothetical protein